MPISNNWGSLPQQQSPKKLFWTEHTRETPGTHQFDVNNNSFDSNKEPVSVFFCLCVLCVSKDWQYLDVHVLKQAEQADELHATAARKTHPNPPRTFLCSPYLVIFCEDGASPEAKLPIEG